MKKWFRKILISERFKTILEVVEEVGVGGVVGGVVVGVEVGGGGGAGVVVGVVAGVVVGVVVSLLTLPSVSKAAIDMLKVRQTFQTGKKLQKPNSKNKSHSFKSWLPTKKREEILGDLFELKETMIQDGLPMWKIKLILKFHIICIYFSFLKIRILDYASGKKKVDKDS